jgi:hypothetical protein
MKALKIGFLTTLAAGVLLGISSLMPAGASAAQIPGAPAAGGSAVGCGPTEGTWTDCWVTLGSDLGSNGAVFAALPAQSGTLALCSGATQMNPGPDDFATQFCSISGNTAVFSCLNGCAAGTQFVVSMLDVPPAADGSLAQQINVNPSNALAPTPQTPLLGGGLAANG